MGNIGRRVLTVALVALLAPVAGRAAAQVLSAPTLANNSSPNDNSNGTNNSYDRQSLLQTQSSAPTTFQVRYSSTLSCDSGAFGANDTRTMSADYSITFNVTAPAGYALDIDTRRTGDANVQYDGGITGGEADMSAITGSITGASFVSGSLDLADPTGGTPDCDINGGTTASCNVPVNQIGTARYTGVSNGVPVSHTLHFTWTQTTFTAAASGHEAAVRLGIQSRDATNNASQYPGSPARNDQPNDGHFIKVTLTSLCGNGTLDVGEQCDQGPANGLGSSCCTSNCQWRGAGEVCRLATSACDPAELCTGSSGACPPDALAPATVVCRAASAGQTCDADELCTGSSSVCPPDLAKPMGTVCRASAGSCDLAEVCDGVSNFCPGDVKSTAPCRASAGVCDVAESCDGLSNNCPADAFQPSSVQCRAPAGVCDVVEHCTGSSAACPADAKSTAVCRAAVGGCDAAESCDGVGNNCPPDVYQPASTVCRAAASPCDVAETCTGTSPVCPGDLFQPASTVCRAAAGACDVAETCTGTSAACPADAFAPATTVCRSAAGTCDIAEHCSGSAAACPPDALAPATTVCRAAASACDIAENCTGASPTCPADTLQPNGASCSNGLFCDGSETCQSGVCTSGTPPCGNCDESTDSCIDGPCSPAPLACRNADKSLLLIRSKLDDNKDKLIWKWLHGAATTQAEFGDPTSTANYLLCIYAGVSQDVVGWISIGPSGSKWSTLGSHGYKYFDVASASDGAQKVVLKGSDSNKSKALLKGRGFLLPDPLDGGPLTFPVSVQLVDEQTGICWGSQFTSATRNTSAQFKAFTH